MMFGYNFALALRGLRQFPRSTALLVVTVAMGLSACMTTLALLHVLSGDPLPGRSQRLYLAWVNTLQAKPRDYASLNGVTNADYRRIKLPDAQAMLAAHRAVRQTVVADMAADETSADGKHALRGQLILATNADFVPMFGVALRYGRNWTAAEDAERAPVVLIDTQLAQTLFGTADAVGRRVRLGHGVFQVVGVIAPYAPQPRFYGLSAGVFSSDGGENLFVPYTAALDAGLLPLSSDGCDASYKALRLSLSAPTHCASLGFWVQLDTPRQVADYRTYLTHYAEQQKVLAGYAKPAQARLYSVAEWLKLQHVIPDSVRLNVWMGSSFLLLCMLNVTGLLAARFLHRSSEVGIRRALGAPRRAVFQQYVLEAGLISLVGGVLAWPLTLLGLWLLRQQGSDFSGLARLDPLMFGGLFALALVVGLLVGLLPAWRASAVEPGLQVKSA